jgi:hypothetical protein
MPININDFQLAEQLSKGQGSGSIVAGLLGLGSKKNKEFIRRKAIAPVMAADISLGRRIGESGPGIRNFAKRYLPRKAANWLGELPGRIFSENIPMDVSKGMMRGNSKLKGLKKLTHTQRVPAITAPISKLRNFVVPALGMIGTFTLLDAIAKRSEKKRKENEWANSLGGGNNGQY